MGCIMRTENDWSPNNFELDYDYDKIASNINLENIPELNKIINKSTPISKRIHINAKIKPTTNIGINTIDITPSIFITQNNKTIEVDYK